MHRNQEGFTLPEILIGLAISSIIIAASFASYIVIKNNYDFQKDMKNISQTSRAVATMIMRDIRMAGYNYDDGPSKQKPEITTPIKITDGGTTAPDSIEIIYDKSYTERLKISYYTKAYNNRLRVYKKVEKCNAMNCATSSLQTVIAESPIADYVEDLQFTGYKNSNALGTGSSIYGQGNMRTITSNDFTITSKQSDPVPGFPKSGDVAYAFDNNLSTFWSCKNSSSALCNNNPSGGLLQVKFNKEVRIEKIYVWNAANAEGGTGSSSDVSSQNWSKVIFPFGDKLSLYGKLGFYINAKKCTWSSSCSPVGVRIHPDVEVFGSYHEISVIEDYKKSVITQLGIQPSGFAGANYGGGKTASGFNTIQRQEFAEIQFFGEVFGEPQNPQEVEVGLLIRSPEEHGTSPVSQTFNIGNRPITTNDNYIRDSYSISALIRNSYYGQ